MADMAQQRHREARLLYTQDSQSSSGLTKSIKRKHSHGSEDFYSPPHKRRRHGFFAPFTRLDEGARIEAAAEEEEESSSPSPQSAAALREDKSPPLDSSPNSKAMIEAEGIFNTPYRPERRRPELFLQYIPPYVDRSSPVFSPLALSPRMRIEVPVETESVAPSPLHQSSDKMLCIIGEYALAYPEEYPINLSPLISSSRMKLAVHVEEDNIPPSPQHQSSDKMLCELGEYALAYPEEYQLNLSPVWPFSRSEVGGVSPCTIEFGMTAREDSAWSMESDSIDHRRSPGSLGSEPTSDYARHTVQDTETRSPQHWFKRPSRRDAVHAPRHSNAPSLMDPPCPRLLSHHTLPVSSSPLPRFRDPFATYIRYCETPESEFESKPDLSDYESEPDLPHYESPEPLSQIPHPSPEPESAYAELKTPEPYQGTYQGSYHESYPTSYPVSYPESYPESYPYKYPDQYPEPYLEPHPDPNPNLEFEANPTPYLEASTATTISVSTQHTDDDDDDDDDDDEAPPLPLLHVLNTFVSEILTSVPPPPRLLHQYQDAYS